MENTDIHYKQLVESLKLIAISNSENSIDAYFPDYVDLSFEVVDTYHNLFLLIPALIEKNLFSNNVTANLIRLEILTNSLVSRSNFENQSYDQFFNSKEWIIIINLAKETLEYMGIPLDKPDFYYI